MGKEIMEKEKIYKEKEEMFKQLREEDLEKENQIEKYQRKIRKAY